MNVHEFAELSAGHALDALSDDDERTYLEALAAHPEWASIAASDDETAAVLAEGVAPVAPPLALRSKLLAAIADRDVEASPLAGGDAQTAVGADAPTLAVPGAPGVPVPGVARDEIGEGPEAAVVADAPSPADPEPTATTVLRTAFAAADAPTVDVDASITGTSGVPAAPPTEVVQTIQRRNWSRGLFALVASIALLVVIGWGTGSVANIWQRPPAVSALAQIEKAPDAASAQATFDGGVATLHWSPSVGEAVVVARGLPEIAADRTFELWYIRGETPIPAGVFDAAGTSATAQLTGTMQPGDTIAVTVEPSGGSPDGKPSTAPVFAIITA